MAYVLTVAGTTKAIQPGWSMSETVNGRATLQCEILSTAGTYRPAIGAEVILTEAGTTIFGGYVDAPAEQGIGASGDTAITTRISCVDYNSLADRRYVIDGGFPSGYTMLQCITSLAGYLPAGFAVDASQATGSSLTAAIVYDVKAVSAILDELAVVFSGLSGTSHIWRIDPATKKLRMYSVGTFTAPVNITEAARYVEGDVTVEPTRADYANRILLLAGTGTSEVTDTFTGNGVTTAFTLTYDLSSNRGYVTNGGVNETLGSGATWSYSAGVITRTSAPANGNAISITYIAQFPYRAQADDAGEQATNGLWEKVLLAPDVFSATIAEAMAEGYLDRTTTTSQTVRYTTRQTGIKPGQTQTITLTKRNLSGTFLITDVTTQDMGGNLVSRTITATSGSVYLGSWRDDVSSGGSSSSGTTVGATVTIVSGGGAGGTGTAGTLTKWATTTSLTNSLLTESGSTVTMAGTLAATTFSGSGASLTSLPAGQLTGTITSATQDLITRTGTLVAGATGAGFTIALTTSTVTGNLPYARMPSGSGTWTAVPTISGATQLQSTLGVTGIATFTTDTTHGGNTGTTSYASQTTGWRVTNAGAADFRNLYTDELTAKSFIADLEQALAGGQIICKSVAIVSSFTVPAASATATLTVEDLPSAPNMAVFVSGDTVVVRSFTRENGGLIIGDAIGVVTSYADQAGGVQTWTFTRNNTANGGSLASTTVIPAKSLALDYGTSGSGYYEVSALDGTVNVTSITRVTTTATVTTTYAHGFKTSDTVDISGAVQTQYNGSFTITVTGTTTFTYTVAGSPATPATGTILVNNTNGTNAPYAQIVTWATSPIGANKTVRTRFGNLRGITGTDAEYGMLAGAYAATNGHYFRASNSAFELHGIRLSMWDGSTEVIRLDETAPSFALGTPVPTAYGTGTGIWMGKDTAYKFRVGVPAGNRVAWDGTNLTVVSANVTMDSTGLSVVPNTSSTFNNANAYRFSVSNGNLGMGGTEIASTSRAWRVESSYTGTTASGPPVTGIMFANWAPSDGAVKYASVTVSGAVGGSSVSLTAEDIDIGIFGVANSVHVTSTDITLSGVVAVDIFGAHTISAIGTGANSLTVRALSAGTGNSSLIQTLNDGSVGGLLQAFASTYTPSGDALANGARLLGNGAGGLSITTTSASAEIRFYTSGFNQRAVFTSDGAFKQIEISATPASPASGTEINHYVKGDKYVLQFNNGGTVRYYYLDLTAASGSWTHTTSAP